MRKQRARADLRSKLLPASPCALKSSLSTKRTKCGFPTFTIAPATSPTPSTTIVRGITRGTPISLSIRYVDPSRFNHTARPHAAMRAQRNLVQPFALRQPCRHASRPVARKLRLAAIRVEQPQKKLAAGTPLQELNPIRPNAGIARAQSLRQAQHGRARPTPLR